ncbi:hypothetical protein RD792_016710 [Penstemon davidsonii]|uniref:LOB domain-containing protein n=1 Tax=Penstemon davidsonii TaxID=160366 RepID=A0ABR0CM01_9LAMI|nr:hypothetical protein RD792_016710 [Penstemon davidsonii]
MSSSSSPCAACKCLRRRCMQECDFAPYFPPDNLAKFSNVHKVYGASNVAKLLNELSPAQREDAVNSLAYEAEYRLRDPVYGCLGLIMMLQRKLKDVEIDLDNAKKELASYIGPVAMFPMVNHPELMQQPPNYGPSAYNMQAMMGLPTRVPQGVKLVIREPQQHHQQLQPGRPGIVGPSRSPVWDLLFQGAPPWPGTSRSQADIYMGLREGYEVCGAKWCHLPRAWTGRAESARPTKPGCAPGFQQSGTQPSGVQGAHPRWLETVPVCSSGHLHPHTYGLEIS